MRKRVAGIKAAALAAAVIMMAGCGQEESEKAYLDEIKAEKYVKLGEYKGLEVVQAPPEVTEEYRDSYIDYLLSLNPEGGAKEGDTVNIDYVGTLDGVAFEGGTAAGKYLQLGSGEFIGGFEEGLIGAKAGDTVELNLTFPENYKSAEMAGKSVVFTVTVNAIMAAEPQELNDAYVKGLGISCDTVEEYRQYVYDLLAADAQAEYEGAIENSLIAMLMESCEFTEEPPRAMVDSYAEALTENLTAEAGNYGMTLEQYMSLGYGIDAETYTNEIRELASWHAKQSIMLQAIANKENIGVSEEELQEELEGIVEISSLYASVEELQEAIDDRRYKESLMVQKVTRMLRENAVVSAE